MRIIYNILKQVNFSREYLGQEFDIESEVQSKIENSKKTDDDSINESSIDSFVDKSSNFDQQMIQ